MARTRPATSEASTDLSRRSRQSLRRRAVVAALPVLGLLLGPSAARAQPEKDRAAAEVLFKEALVLIDAGAWTAGCPKFEQSYRLYSSRSTMIHIARCHAHEGKIATAWDDYQRALRLESPGNDATRQRSLAVIAATEAQALEPRLPRLRIVITNLPAGAQVLRDGMSLRKDALDQPSPVDPGPHEVTASAPGYRKETRPVLLREGETLTVKMTLVAVPPPAPPPAQGWVLPAGVTLAVAGALGLGAGAATGAASLDVVDDVRTSCGGTHCLSTDTAAQQDVSTAKTLGNVSTASFIAGGALAAAGGALLVVRVLSSSKDGAAETPAATLQATFGPGEITLRGRF